ncbi:MAG: helix-turn-helix domain-containing protein [Flammeovirgaceae bacterium]
MKQSRKTVQEILSEIGISQGTYYNYKSGKSFPDIPVLISISEFFNVGLEEICNTDITKNYNPVAKSDKSAEHSGIDIETKSKIELNLQFLSEKNQWLTEKEKLVDDKKLLQDEIVKLQQKIVGLEQELGEKRRVG